MTGFDTEFIELFRDETARRLDQMDNLLLEIESGDAGAEGVNSLFRHAHTIKGAAGMLGFDDVRALEPATEDVLARVHDASEFSPEIAAPLLRATAAMRVNIAGSDPPTYDVHAILAVSQAELPGGAVSPETGEARSPLTVLRMSDAPGARQAPGSQTSLRVPADKIDHLLD